MTRYDDIFEVIESLSAADSVSADEGDVRALLAEQLDGLFDFKEEDALGNLIFSRAGEEPLKTLFASMDEPGLVVTHVDNDGMLHVAAVGDVSAREALGSRVRFKGGTLGLVVAGGEQGGSLDFASLRIDVGASSKEEAERLVKVGARAAYDVPLRRQGDVVIGKALESRVGCAVLIQALKRSKAEGLRVVFTAQERLGGRGLAALASSGRRFGEAVGVVLVDASPQTTAGTAVTAGAGPALVVQDATHIGDLGMHDRLNGAALQGGIAVQRCVTQSGSRGAGSLQRAPGGVSLAMLGIPGRNTGGITQIAHLGDARAAAELLARWADGP